MMIKEDQVEAVLTDICPSVLGDMECSASHKATIEKFGLAVRGEYF